MVVRGLGRCCGYDPEFGPHSYISNKTRLIARIALVLVLVAVVTAVIVW